MMSGLNQWQSQQEVAIGFAIDKASISPRYKRQLGNVADFMWQNQGTIAVITGHTDSTGTLHHNIDLSRRRAESIKTYLSSLGIAPSRLITRGYGPCSPIAGNLTHAGRQKNRRATAVVTFVNLK